MTKTLKLMAVLAAFAAFSVTSCKEQEPEEQPKEQPAITVAPTTLSFDSAAASKDLTVKSNTDWTVTSDASWLTVSPLKGSKDGSVSVAATANVGEAGAAASAREAVITFAIEGKKVDVKVNQSAEAIVFLVSGDTAEIPAAGGQVAVKVEYNESYTADALPEWISAATKATKTDNLVFYVAANDNAEAREGVISFKSASGKTGSVTVKQAGTPAPVDVKNITNAEQLLNFLSTYAAAATEADTYTLEADIDISDANIVPAASFKGTFDGQNHLITWKYSTDTTFTDLKAGVFASVAGTVKDLKVKGTISQKEDEGIYYKNAFIGGIAAEAAETAVFQGCSSELAIVMRAQGTAARVGGIVGNSLSGAQFENCNATGSVTLIAPGTTADQAGGIIGHSAGNVTVKNCKGSVNMAYYGTSTPRFGGIIGYTEKNTNLLVSGCEASGTQKHMPGTVKKQYTYLGGIIGYTNTFAETTGSYVIENCKSSVVFESAADSPAAEFQFRAGGIIAQMPKGEGVYSGINIKGSSFDGSISVEITGTSAKTNTIQLGGIMAFGETTAVATIDGCTMSGKISSKGYKTTMGGILGHSTATTSSITNCVVTKDAEFYADQSTSSIGVVAGTPSAYTTQVTAKMAPCKYTKVESIDITSENYKTYAFANTSITDLEGITWDGPVVTKITINSVDDFLALVANTEAQADAGLIVELGADLDFAGKTAAELQVPAFAGTFDGKGHSIKNFTTVGVGLFKALSGTLKNLVIDSSCQLQMNGDANSAVVVMTNTGIIDGITVNADVTGTITTSKTTRHSGCICSINRNIIKNCVNNGNATFTAATATAQYRYAPIVGSNSNTTNFDGPSVINCVNYGNVTFTQTEGVNSGDKYFSGIAAVCDSKTETLIENCVNYGKITFTSANPASPKLYPGGLIGLHKGGIVKNCKNFGDVENNATEPTSAAGGLVGCLKNDTAKIGADVNESFIGCAVNCKVICPSTAAGIVLGCMTTATDKFVFGTEAAPIKVAGQVGETVINAENFKTVLLGSAFELNDDRKVNAVFEAVAK